MGGNCWAESLCSPNTYIGLRELSYWGKTQAMKSLNMIGYESSKEAQGVLIFDTSSNCIQCNYSDCKIEV